MIQVLFAAGADRWGEYEAPLRAAYTDAGLDVHMACDIAPEAVDYIIYAPDSELRDFTPFTRTKAVLNLWAGVEKIVGNSSLSQPLCRMVDPSLTQGMVEWVIGHVLRHHLGIDAHIKGQSGVWAPEAPPVAWDRRIAVLGLGELGAACALHLVQLGFQVSGWSRGLKTLDGVDCHAGEAGLIETLQGADGLVLLLPDTPATTNIMNSERFGLLAPGAFLINPGRGPLIDDDALITALDSGQLGHATLDVFRVEPLPAGHPFWQHPGVTVTPHIASETRPKWSAISVAENIKRGEAGQAFLHLVDRTLGY